jgi:hypothetical protein
MRYRLLLIAVGLLAAAVSVYGQASLTGKWQTDNVPAALEAQKNAVNEIGDAPVLNIETGSITGKTITRVTPPTVFHRVK